MSSIEKVHYTHDAMIDLIIANPSINQGEIAREFGYTEAWVSQVFSSDAFKARLAARKAELVDPLIAAAVEQRLEGLARRSMDVLFEKLDAAPTGDLALECLKVSTKALGYGARDPRGAVAQANVVVVVPGVARSSTDWARAYAPTPALEVAPSSSTTH